MGKKLKKLLNFPRNDKNILGGACSSHTTTTEGVSFGEIASQKGQILVYLDERILMIVVVVIYG